MGKLVGTTNGAVSVETGSDLCRAGQGSKYGKWSVCIQGLRSDQKLLRMGREECPRLRLSIGLVLDGSLEDYGGSEEQIGRTPNLCRRCGQ